MSNAKRLEEKDPGEAAPLSWDFTDDLGDADINGTPTVTIAVDTSLRRNADFDPDSMLSGAPQVSGKKVIQLVQGGVHGVDYKVKCMVVADSTPAARIYKSSILPVRNQ